MIEKMTLGEASRIAPLLDNNDERVRAVDASKPCWVYWPDNLDEEPAIFLSEADALAATRPAR